MNFAELVAAVVTDTNRPDLDSSQGGDGQIQQAVSRATAFLHSLDFFKKDIVPVQVQFDQAVFIQTLNTQIFPRYRAASYARKNDTSLATSQQNPTILPPLYNKYLAVNISDSMAMFEMIELDKIFDEYGYRSEKTNIFYQAGDTLFFKSTTAFKEMLFAYYAYPNVDTSNNGENFESWIARDMPFAIIAVADSNIFANTGKTDVARKHDAPDGIVAQWVHNLLTSNIEGVGR